MSRPQASTNGLLGVPLQEVMILHPQIEVVCLNFQVFIGRCGSHIAKANFHTKFTTPMRTVVSGDFI